jgi:hypothetical protein
MGVQQICRSTKFPLVSMGLERRVKRAKTRDRGPPSAPAEIDISYHNPSLYMGESGKKVVVVGCVVVGVKTYFSVQLWLQPS